MDRRIFSAMRRQLHTAALLLLSFGCDGQEQVADLKADVEVSDPAFAPGTGPKVVVDAAHGNFHTIEGRFAPFAALLRNDGFRVEQGALHFTDSSLAGVDVLVIANAEPVRGGSAFTVQEIAAVKRFVAEGGSLLLIADHTPFPLAVMEMSASFSVHFLDVYAEDDDSGTFKLGHTLMDDTITRGVASVRTFGGSAFTVEGVPHRPLLVMNEEWTTQQMVSNGLSEKSSARGLLQGAVMPEGQGRLAVFGEAAMFTAQRIGRHRMGFHAPHAEGNKQFILALMRWLVHLER